MLQTYDCAVCGKSFQRRRVQAERSKVVCCSHRCWGDFLKGKPRIMAMTPTQRFWSHVDRKGPDECWEWRATVTSGGYGHATINGKYIAAHRLAWLLTYGPIPPGNGHHGTCVCHHCDNRACVNPNHLFLGSHQDNIRDMVVKGRKQRRPGSENNNAKLSNEQVLEIRSRSNGSDLSIASEFGVARSTVRSIRLGETWRHILPENYMPMRNRRRLD